MNNGVLSCGITYELCREGAGIHRTYDTDSGTDILMPTITPELVEACCYTPSENPILTNKPILHIDNRIHIPGCTGILIPTGVKVDLPPGTDLTVFDKSGVAKKHLVHVNGGLVDNPYTGEIHVHLMNLSNYGNIEIDSGMKLAQFVVRPVYFPVWSEGVVDKVTDRGDGSHGSTGTHA